MQLKDYQAIKSRLRFTTSYVFLVRHAALDILIWTSAVILHWSADHIAADIVAGVLVGLFMFRSFSVMHEAVHGTLAKNQSVNSNLGSVYGVFTLLPFNSWRKVHLDHHLWTGNLDKDPTMRLILGHREGTLPTSKAQDIFWRAWMPYLAWRQQLVFWRKSIEAKGWKVKFQAAASIIYLGVMGVVLGPAALAVAVFTYLMIVELINFPHHMDLHQGGGTLRLPANEQHRFSRTCLYPRWFSHFVLLNFNFHVEHHLFPNLPWSELPKAHLQVFEVLAGQYHVSRGNDWIVSSRAKSLSEVMDRSIDWSFKRAAKPSAAHEQPKAA